MNRLRTLSLFLILATASVFAGEKNITFSGGDGSSFEKAVVILGATEATGVSAEYDYLRKNFPRYSPGKQSLVEHNKRMYDILEISNGSAKKSVYFDITDFFGKF